MGQKLSPEADRYKKTATREYNKTAYAQLNMRLPKNLVEGVKEKAGEQGKSLREFVAEILKKEINMEGIKMKALLYWVNTGIEKGGRYGVQFPTNTGDYTSEWESLDADSQVKAIEISLPDGWKAVEMSDGLEMGIETPDGEVILASECQVSENSMRVPYGESYKILKW